MGRTDHRDQDVLLKGEGGNKPYELELILQIYMQQSLFDLLDMATVAEARDSRTFSEFCGVDSSNQVPDRGYAGAVSLPPENGIQQKLFG